MRLDFLCNHEHTIPILAEWYFDEWGHLAAGNSAEKIAEQLRSYLNQDRIPLTMLALELEKPIGAAQLKFHEMDIYPDKDHWLGGVYVSPAYRGCGIAEAIVHEIVTVAKRLGVTELHLQTQDPTGGLYRRLGWQSLEVVNSRGFDVLVMNRRIR